MATFAIDDAFVREIVSQITRDAIAELDLPAIVKAAVLEASKLAKQNVKVAYSAGEVARLLGITVVALQARRLNGHIRGTREVGGRSFMYSRAEVERVLGRSLADY